jgi:hypothetical protein
MQKPAVIFNLFFTTKIAFRNERAMLPQPLNRLDSSRNGSGQ